MIASGLHFDRGAVVEFESPIIRFPVNKLVKRH